MKNQAGVALVTSILLLLILTLVAVSLATRSRATTQMATASVAREEAVQLANGEQEGFIEQERLSRGDSQFITTPDGAAPADPANPNANPNLVTFIVESSCRRSRNATASGVLACRQSELESTIVFGRNNRGSLSVVAGVEQPVLRATGG
ncbi:pilus assembly protein PilX [uncultured Ferrimonas sp.]|uniref:pilus assembly protein PilX n=1 Tax=uncultured Ferrimonas sp. TaxID=432640 RepID=UPI002612FC60|nr:pilus assembly protein PilX [uncultured Ferrimonas sp.]